MELEGLVTKGMFEGSSLDEVYRTSMEQDKIIRSYKEQGAVLNGEREIDKKYTAALNEALEYSMQLSTDELELLMVKGLVEAGEIKLE